MCSHYNLDCIKAQDLANWAEGLEAPLNSYAPKFLETRSGNLASLLTDDELVGRSVVNKIGHLINMREKLSTLVRVLYDVKDETVESLVMKYQRGARSLETIILRKRYEFAPQQVHSATRATVPNNVLSHVCDMLATGREICSWLIKAPFNESRSYIDLAETFMVTNKAIGYCVVGDRWTAELEEDLAKKCRDIQELCRDFLDDCTDSSIITPAFLEQVCLKRKNPSEKLGLMFKLSLEGIHVVSGIRPNTPAAHVNAKLDIFDEIVQIDYTCVTNWTLDSILNKFKAANPAEVFLTLRKRPRHMSMDHQLRRMKTLCPPDAQKQAKRRSRKSTIESFNKQPSASTSVPLSSVISPKKISTAAESSRGSFLNQQDARKGSDALSSSHNRSSVNRTSLSAKLGSLKRRSSSAQSLLKDSEEKVKPIITVAKPIVAAPSAFREEVLPSVSSCDPSTSSGALSSDQDSQSGSQTQSAVIQPVQEKHTVIDRRVSIKDLGETEISGNLNRKKAENDWVCSYCVIKNGFFYVFASPKAEKADVVVHLKAVDVEKTEQQDNFKFVFTMNFCHQQKKFVFAAENRLDLGHWVNNLHTAKLLLNSKKSSVAVRNTLAVETEIDECLVTENYSFDKSIQEGFENFSETDDEEEPSEKPGSRFEKSSESLDMLKYSFLSSSGHSPFSRSSTLEESAAAGLPLPAVLAPTTGSDNPSNQNLTLMPLGLAIPGSSDSVHRTRSSETTFESELMESTQSVKLVLTSEINEESAVKVWEEPRTEMDRLKSKLRALERKLLAKQVDLEKIERLIKVGQTDPSQLLLSPVYHEETSGLTWNAPDEEEQSTVDTEL